ncbi:MAG: HdeD family acid-resistance protein [Acidimicrobiales bacterium]
MSTVTSDDGNPPADAARLWWLGLVAGIVSVLYGLFVLSLRPGSVLSLAILAGIAFIFGGLTQFLVARRVDSWRWLFYVGGLLAIAAGIAAFVWPDVTLRVMAVFLAWYLVLGGILTVIDAFLGPKYDWWWLHIVLGMVMFLLGAWAVGSPLREVLLFVNLVGFYLLLNGLTEIVAAFAIRSAGKAAAESGRHAHASADEHS